MRVTRMLKVAPALAVVAGLLVGGVGSPAGASLVPRTAVLHHESATTLFTGRARQENVRAATANMPRGGELVQPEADGATFCLDAVTVGSLAGKNGDPVVLYDCSGGSNQYWYEGPPYPGPDGNYHVLHSSRYPSLCLNADQTGGLKDGRKVMLWSCNGASNELWNMYYFVFCLGMTDAPCPLKLHADAPDGNALVLDALDAAPKSGDLKNGDEILIWEYSSAPNRNWTVGPSGISY